MGRKIKYVVLLGLSCILCLFLVFSSYASFQMTDLSIAKSSKVTWEDAKKEIESKLQNTADYHLYTLSTATKDLQYIRYVCLTHGVDYTEYAELEEQFINAVKEEADITLKAYDSGAYRSEFVAYEEFEKVNGSEKERTIASCGFSYKKDVLPFENLSFTDSHSGGVCSGMSFYELNYYINPKSLEKLDFKDLLEVLDDTDYGYAKKLDVQIDAKGDRVFSLKHLVDYEPSNAKFRAQIPKELRKNWESQDNIQEARDITLADLDGDDYRLCSTILWLWMWQNNNKLKQEAALVKLGHKDKTLNVVPYNTLEFLEREFELGRPVVLGLGRPNGGRHAILGYKLTQDKDEPNLYYLYVADSNLPGNLYDGIKQEVKICMYKTSYKGKPALYLYYAPLKSTNDSSEYVYLEAPVFYNFNCRVLNTSTKISSWGSDTTGITVAINLFSGISVK